MFSPDLRYSKFTDCGSCAEYRRNIFKYRSYPKGLIIPRERCLQNTLYFLLKGSVQVNSEEHPNTIFSAGQFILQPIGSNSRSSKPPNVSCTCLNARSISATNVSTKGPA